MPTYKDDFHTGHKVVLVETDDIMDGGITTEKMADRAVTTEKIADKAVTEAKLEDEAVTTPKIAKEAVTTQKIADEAVTPEKLSEEVENNVIMPPIDALREEMNEKIDDLQEQINALEIYGAVVSQEFGNNEHIGISQKTLTNSINKLWEKIEEMTGETIQGVNMVVSPNYYIGEEGATVHITADTVDTNGVFEKIQFFGNGQLIAEAENVEFFEYDTEIHETTVIMCKAKVMGVEYTKQQVVTHYSSYWLGCGATYQDVMVNANLIPVTEGMRGSYDIVCAQGEHIIIILGESLRPGFVRADMNSFEIPFAETQVTINGNVYAVLTSENVYQAGTYNIDINS